MKLFLLLLLPAAALSQPNGSAEYVVSTLKSAEEALGERDGRAEQRRALSSLDRMGAVPHNSDAGDTLQDLRKAARLKSVPPMRGRLLGPAYRRGELGVGQQLQIQQLFAAGQPAEAAVLGAKNAPFSLTVRQEEEAPVCEKSWRSCKWQPQFTRRYTITIRNEGQTTARYYLALD
jgi:hypothetical protein